MQFTKLFEYKDDSSDEEMLAEVGKILRGGGIVGIPTETVYGLAASAFDGDAVAKIFKAKGRPQDNPLIVHICDMAGLDGVVSVVPEGAKKLAEKFWPGPLSIIMPKGDKIPDEVSCGLETVAVRMPSHPAAAAIIRAAGVPLAAPSANLSGSPSPTTAKRVFEDMNGKADAIVDGGSCNIGVESTVVSLVGDKPRLLRPGGISLEQLESVLGEIEVDSAVLSQLEPGRKAASPGMKYKHYSPKARVIIVKGSFEKYKQFVSGRKNAVAVCFNSEGKFLDIPFIEIGTEHDSPAQAHLLFEALRELDEMGAEVAYARCPDTDGVGLAVINRLLRAAAFNVVDLDGAVVIGLTGQTGAGKSTVSAMLYEKYEFSTIDGDVIAREITQKGSPVLLQLAEKFGGDILDGNGELNRKLLAERAFSSPEKTALLNGVTHPAITMEISRKIKEYSAAGFRAVVLDAAALYEAGIDKMCHFTVAVVAPQEIRLKRIKKRDSIDESAALRRMNAQLTQAEYERRADIIVRNYAPFSIETEVEKIIERYKETKK